MKIVGRGEKMAVLFLSLRRGHGERSRKEQKGAERSLSLFSWQQPAGQPHVVSSAARQAAQTSQLQGCRAEKQNGNTERAGTVWEGHRTAGSKAKNVRHCNTG